jgi:hypothetical protein
MIWAACSHGNRASTGSRQPLSISEQPQNPLVPFVSPSKLLRAALCCRNRTWRRLNRTVARRAFGQFSPHFRQHVTESSAMPSWFGLTTHHPQTSHLLRNANRESLHAKSDAGRSCGKRSCVGRLPDGSAGPSGVRCSYRWRHRCVDRRARKSLGRWCACWRCDRCACRCRDRRRDTSADLRVSHEVRARSLLSVLIRCGRTTHEGPHVGPFFYGL